MSWTGAVFLRRAMWAMESSRTQHTMHNELLGKTAVKSTSDLRKSYVQSVKSNPRDLTFQSGGINFSNDHSMAWDHGTFSQISDGPNGKPVKASGTFLNVWKNVGGQWRIVAEISSSAP